MHTKKVHFIYSHIYSLAGEDNTQPHLSQKLDKHTHASYSTDDLEESSESGAFFLFAECGIERYVHTNKILRGASTFFFFGVEVSTKREYHYS